MMNIQTRNKAIKYYKHMISGIRKAQKEHRYHQLSSILVNNAISDVSDGMSKSSVARKYGISRQTLYRYLRNINCKEVIKR